MPAIFVEEENVGCVIYACHDQTEERFINPDRIITLETPFYKENSNYKERIGAEIKPSDGTLVEGISELHFFIDGEEKKIGKMTLYRPAAKVVYQILAEKADRYGYVPYEETASGDKCKKEYVDLITLLLSRWRTQNQSLRVPWKMKLDPTWCADVPRLFETLRDDEFGRVIDSVRKTFQSHQWAVRKVLALDSLVTLFV